MKHLAIEKDNKLTPYSRSLLELSIIEAFRGVELDHQLIDTLTDTLEIKLLNLSQSTIAAGTVSEVVLHTLKPINKRAYLHYLADRS
jgi:transcriptional regulator NrdR family protein